MPRITNGYADNGDTFSGSLANLAKSFFGDQAKEEVNRQTAFGKMRENDAAEAATNAYRSGDLKEMAAQYLRAFRPAADASGYNLLGESQRAKTPGDMPLQNAQIGHGGGYNATRSGQDLLSQRAADAQLAAADRAAAGHVAAADRTSATQLAIDNRTLIDMQDPNGNVVPVQRSAVGDLVTKGWRSRPKLEDAQAAFLAPPGSPTARVQNTFAQVGNAIDDGTMDPQGSNNIDPRMTRPPMDADRRALMKLPHQPHNYVVNGQNFITYDGTTDARTGQPLTPGGHMANTQGSTDQVGLRPNVIGGLQNADIAAQKTQKLIDFTRAAAQHDPTNFGVAGYVKGVAQDVTQLAGNVAVGLGYPGLNDAVNAVKTQAAANGINPSILSGIYDPNLSKLHTAADLLVFSAAESLAGQSGRNVSDKDVILFKNIVGNPQEWMTSQEKYLSKLNTIEQILSMNQGVTKSNLPQPAGAPAPQQQPAQAAPQAPQQPAQTTPVQVEKWIRGPDGRPQRVQ